MRTTQCYDSKSHAVIVGGDQHEEKHPEGAYYLASAANRRCSPVPAGCGVPANDPTGSATADHGRKKIHWLLLLDGTRIDAKEEFQRMGVTRVAVPNRNSKSSERRKLQKTRWFRAGQRWRTECKAALVCLKRRYGLNRCRYRGFEGMRRWIGLGIIADNVYPHWPLPVLTTSLRSYLSTARHANSRAAEID
jgi:hypothetical protein